MPTTLHLDVSKLRAKMRRVPQEMPRIMRDVVKVDAKGFVKDVVAITPPSMGKLGADGKRRGHARIARDIGRIFRHARAAYDSIKQKSPQLAALFWKQVRGGEFTAATQTLREHGTDDRLSRARVVAAPAAVVHQRMRGRRGGISANAHAQQVVATKRPLLEYIKTEQLKVGKLAAGFTAAARYLGQKLPDWITRHGTKRSTIKVETAPNRFTLTIANKAPHGAANDLPRRVAYVLESVKRTRRATNALKYALAAAIKKAGLGR